MEGDYDCCADCPVTDHISIHTLRMEGDHSRINFHPVIYISIHTLRMEGDWLKSRFFDNPDISIHTLRMEGDVSI